MHATFDDLLRLRNDSVDGPLAAHVRSCAECREQLEQLQARTEGLRRLPAQAPAPDRWEAIQRALNAPPQRVETALRAQPAVERRPGWLLPAASAALVVLAVVVTLQLGTGTLDEPAPVADPASHELVNAVNAETAPVVGAQNAARLIEESQRLEELLATYTQAPRLTRASTELTVADLEDRIQWVDYRLNHGAEAGLDAYQSQSLWRERVELLNSLVAVRYAEARTTAF